MHFIFEVHVEPGYTAEQYADAWVRASRLIQQAPGARGTRLHRKIGDPSVLLAIATWASKAARDAMESRPDERVRAIIAEQAQFVNVRVIGEFEAAEWVVEPGIGDDAPRDYASPPCFGHELAQHRYSGVSRRALERRLNAIIEAQAVALRGLEALLDEPLEADAREELESVRASQARAMERCRARLPGEQ